MSLPRTRYISTHTADFRCVRQFHGQYPSKTSFKFTNRTEMLKLFFLGPKCKKFQMTKLWFKIDIKFSENNQKILETL